MLEISEPLPLVVAHCYWSVRRHNFDLHHSRVPIRYAMLSTGKCLQIDTLHAARYHYGLHPLWFAVVLFRFKGLVVMRTVHCACMIGVEIFGIDVLKLHSLLNGMSADGAAPLL